MTNIVWNHFNGEFESEPPESEATRRSRAALKAQVQIAVGRHHFSESLGAKKPFFGFLGDMFNCFDIK
tara:strand:+ start:372 stop:575 length:204 start_codon:yes stop_codon:yes gene_type:complete